MAREHRRLTHELAHLYFVGTIAAGVEPQRFVSLVRTDRTALPPCTLTEAAARRGAESEAAEGAGAGAGPPRAFGWPLELYQVQCDERALSSLVGPAVRQLKSEYAVSYEPSARRARQAARDALALRAREEELRQPEQLAQVGVLVRREEARHAARAEVARAERERERVNLRPGGGAKVRRARVDSARGAPSLAPAGR